MNGFLRGLLFLPPQASTVAVRVDHLHYFIIIATMLASVGVGLWALVLFVRYRRRSEQQPSSRVNATRGTESLIVAGPLFFFLLWFVIGFRTDIEITTPPAGAMDVYVSAKQWMWKFSYPQGPNSIGILRVPAGRPVRLLMTSRDVIHSFFVPDFRIKQDVLPGRYVQTWFEARWAGRFQILCTQYCGTGHSFMRGEVVAMPPGTFDRWLAQARRGLATRQDSGPVRQPPEGSASMAVEGRRLAVEFECLKCHTVDGTAHIGPTWLGLYHRVEVMDDGEKVFVDEGYLTESMMEPMVRIVAGYAPVMPTFQGRLTGPEAAAVVEYIKSLTAPAGGESTRGGAR